MIDYCLKLDDEAAFDALLEDAGLEASADVLIDRIGPITMGDVTYPEYYANVRLLVEPTEEQADALAPFAIDPSQPQYRVWA